MTYTDNPLSEAAFESATGTHADRPSTVTISHGLVTQVVSSPSASVRPPRSRERPPAPKSKRRGAGILAAIREADRLRKEAELKQHETYKGVTRIRSTKIRNYMCRLFGSLDLSLLENGATEACMPTLKYVGRGNDWLKSAGDDKTVNSHITQLAEIHAADWGGAALRFLWFKEFAVGNGAPHLHLLLCPTPGLSRQGLSFPDWLEDVWARVTNQKSRRLTHTREDRLTWVPNEDEMPKHDTVVAAFEAFQRYEAEKYNPTTGKHEVKTRQKLVPKEWLKKGINRVRFYGAVNMQPEVLFQGYFRCECGQKEFRSLMKKHSTAKTLLKLRPHIDGGVEHFDASRFSLETMYRGASEYTRHAPSLVKAVKQIVEAHSSCSPPSHDAGSNDEDLLPIELLFLEDEAMSERPPQDLLQRFVFGPDD